MPKVDSRLPTNLPVFEVNLAAWREVIKEGESLKFYFIAPGKDILGTGRHGTRLAQLFLVVWGVLRSQSCDKRMDLPWI